MARPKGLTKKIVREIRSSYNGGEITQAELAVRFGVSQSTICKVVNYCTHKNPQGLELCGSAQVKLGIRW